MSLKINSESQLDHKCHDMNLCKMKTVLKQQRLNTSQYSISMLIESSHPLKNYTDCANF